MACHRVGTKPLSEPMLGRILLIGPLGTKFREILIEIHINTFESAVCEMSATLSRSQCVKHRLNHYLRTDIFHNPFFDVSRTSTGRISGCPEI